MNTIQGENKQNKTRKKKHWVATSTLDLQNSGFAYPMTSSFPQAFTLNVNETASRALCRARGGERGEMAFGPLLALCRAGRLPGGLMLLCDPASEAAHRVVVWGVHKQCKKQEPTDQL